MDKPPIRIVNIPSNDLAACNIENLVRVFGGISQQPGKAKALRGLVFLGFPSFENDRRSNWAIPEIRDFIRKLDGTMPHFCYFLTTEVPFGFLRIYMYCLVNTNPDGSIQSQAFQALVTRLERDVRGFCDRIADQPEPIIEKIMMNLPATVVHRVPHLRRAALRSLLPTLSSIVEATDVSPKLKKTAFGEAESLLGTTVAACGTELDFLARLRNEAAKRD